MINYIKFIAYFFFLTLECLIKFIFSLFNYRPCLDLSSWVAIMIQARQIRATRVKRENSLRKAEMDYKNTASEAYEDSGVKFDE